MKNTIILLNEGTKIKVTQGLPEVSNKIYHEVKSDNDTNYITLMMIEEKTFLFFFRSVNYFQIRLNLKRILFFYETR